MSARLVFTNIFSDLELITVGGGGGGWGVLLAAGASYGDDERWAKCH